MKVYGLTHGIVEVHVDVFLYLDTHVNKFLKLVAGYCLFQSI